MEEIEKIREDEIKAKINTSWWQKLLQRKQKL